MYRSRPDASVHLTPNGLFALDLRFEEVFEGFCVGGEFPDAVGELFNGHLVFVEVEPRGDC